MGKRQREDDPGSQPKPKRSSVDDDEADDFIEEPEPSQQDEDEEEENDQEIDHLEYDGWHRKYFSKRLITILCIFIFPWNF